MYRVHIPKKKAYLALAVIRTVSRSGGDVVVTLPSFPSNAASRPKSLKGLILLSQKQKVHAELTRRGSMQPEYSFLTGLPLLTRPLEDSIRKTSHQPNGPWSAENCACFSHRERDHGPLWVLCNPFDLKGMPCYPLEAAVGSEVRSHLLMHLWFQDQILSSEGSPSGGGSKAAASEHSQGRKFAPEV